MSHVIAEHKKNTYIVVPAVCLKLRNYVKTYIRFVSRRPFRLNLHENRVNIMIICYNFLNYYYFAF